ncbi:hypothetical protein GGX14DRAFT_430093 [Mycena pura]|uniref:Uncharacterized protein n=1 Tax=Mycena pura TaxID=153505 RepID=A0AAD6YK82_9AGAR|nr:hypothetical protein GGX14DRAFT_430093 [Mycena pura]
MRDPYWEALHAALDAAALSNSALLNQRSPKHMNIGDFGICFENPKLRPIVYEFLVSRGYALTKKEKTYLESLTASSKAHARPCVVVGRHGPGSYVVCFLASANSRDTAELSPMIHQLSIPFGDNQKEGLRAEPPFVSRLLFALPVVRSAIIATVRQGQPPIRQQLAYGELERARLLIRAKIAEFKANHETLRRQELALTRDKSHPGDRPLLQKVDIHQPRIAQKPGHGKLSRQRFRNKTGEFWEVVHDPMFIPPHSAHNNISWILKHANDYFADASRYLSSVVDPPPPPFRLPRPFYSSVLRASTSFIRRRIIPL